MGLSRYKGVWIFAEQRRGVTTPVVKKLLDEGGKLAKDVEADVCAILLGKGVGCLARELIRYRADKVYVADHPLFKSFITDAYTKVITGTVGTYQPKVVLYDATHIGRDLAPKITTRTNAGPTANCTGLPVDPQDKKIIQTHPVFGGNLMATVICPKHHPQMSTVRPDIIQKLKPDDSRQDEIINMDVKLGTSDIRTQVLEIVKSAKEMVSLTDADMIVSDGHGLSNAEGFTVIRKLADAMDDVVSTSGTAVDAGWIGHLHQVGQTGTTVKPKLYVACGTSGAIQHLAGMQSSDIIIAINKNSRAPTFKVADYGLVGDLHEIVPMVAEAFADEEVI